MIKPSIHLGIFQEYRVLFLSRVYLKIQGMKKGKIVIRLIPNVILILIISILGLGYCVGKASIRDYQLAYQEVDSALKETRSAYIEASDANTIHVIIKTTKRNSEETLANILKGENNEKSTLMPSAVGKIIIRK